MYANNGQRCPQCIASTKAGGGGIRLLSPPGRQATVVRAVSWVGRGQGRGSQPNPAHSIETRSHREHREDNREISVFTVFSVFSVTL